MTPDAPPTPLDGPAPAAGFGRSILVGLGILLLLFGGTVVGLPVMWWTRYGYTQGFVVAAAAVFVLWRDRRRIRQAAVESDRPTPLVHIAMAAFSLLWLVAWVTSVQVVAQLAFLAVITLWGLAVLGLSSARFVLPAAATVLLGIPFWDFLVPVLREITVIMSSTLVSLLRIPAEIEGDTIVIRYGAFIVENGCAGQAYLLAGLTVGALYSHLFMRGWKTRVGVVLLAGGIALLSNWVRITHLVWLGDASQMQSELIYDHGDHGWLVFTLSLIPFFLLARWMERWNAPSRTAMGGTGDAGSSAGDSEGGAAAGAPAEDPGIGPRRRLVPATLVAAAGPALFVMVSALPATAPPEIGPRPADPGWLADGGVDVTPWDIDFSGMDRASRTVFVREDHRVQAEELSFRRQTQGVELISGQNRIAPDSLVLRRRALGPLPPRGRRVLEAWVGTPERVDLVWYWYRVAGMETTSSTEAKIFQLLGFVTRRLDAQLVALSSPCDGENCQGAARALFEFVTGEELPAEDGGERPGTSSDPVSDPAEDQADDAAEDGGHE